MIFDGDETKIIQRISCTKYECLIDNTIISSNIRQQSAMQGDCQSRLERTRWLKSCSTPVPRMPPQVIASTSGRREIRGPPWRIVLVNPTAELPLHFTHHQPEINLRLDPSQSDTLKYVVTEDSAAPILFCGSVLCFNAIGVVYSFGVCCAAACSLPSSMNDPMLDKWVGTYDYDYYTREFLR